MNDIHFEKLDTDINCLTIRRFLRKTPTASSNDRSARSPTAFVMSTALPSIPTASSSGVIRGLTVRNAVPLPVTPIFNHMDRSIVRAIVRSQDVDPFCTVRFEPLEFAEIWVGTKGSKGSREVEQAVFSETGRKYLGNEQPVP